VGVLSAMKTWPWGDRAAVEAASGTISEVGAVSVWQDWSK
jgi:hypothetical protein